MFLHLCCCCTCKLTHPSCVVRSVFMKHFRFCLLEQKNRRNRIPRELTVGCDLFPLRIWFESMSTNQKPSYKQLIKHVQRPVWGITGTGFERKTLENCAILSSKNNAAVLRLFLCKITINWTNVSWCGHLHIITSKSTFTSGGVRAVRCV